MRKKKNKRPQVWPDLEDAVGELVELWDSHLEMLVEDFQCVGSDFVDLDDAVARLRQLVCGPRRKPKKKVTYQSGISFHGPPPPASAPAPEERFKVTIEEIDAEL